MSMRNPLTPAGIETATFRFVAQKSLMHLLYISRYITFSYVLRGAGRRHLQGVLRILVLCGAFVVVYSIILMRSLLTVLVWCFCNCSRISPVGHELS